MLNENEVIMLILGISIFFLIYIYRIKIKRICCRRILLAGFYALLAAWLCTNAEELFWNSILNIMEHLFYTASSILVAFWCWRTSSGLWKEHTNE